MAAEPERRVEAAVCVPGLDVKPGRQENETVFEFRCNTTY